MNEHGCLEISGGRHLDDVMKTWALEAMIDVSIPTGVQIIAGAPVNYKCLPIVEEVWVRKPSVDFVLRKGNDL